MHIRESIEIDSLGVIDNLVTEGLGVPIVPRRLVLVQAVSRPKTRLDLALGKIFSDPTDRPRNGVFA